MHREQGFLQYLLARGKLDIASAKQVLAAYPHTVPDLALRAYASGLIHEAADSSLKGLIDVEFIAVCEEIGCMPESVAQNFVEFIPQPGLRMAETIAATGILSRSTVAEAYQAYVKTEESFLRQAMKALSDEELEQEIFLYTEYMNVFLRSMEDFLEFPAVVLPRTEVEDVKKEFSQMVAQTIEGAKCMETAIAGADGVFYALASAYAHEDIGENEELATDSMKEFLNVVNGNYAVLLDQRDIDVDLSLPRFGRKIKILPSRLLEVPLATPAGSCLVILATDRFL
ncbi:hypothetical protein TAMA11512_11840 [Selenomonas sp. TAMA-11512]|uniref:hypothetical protein n=1 Tax=Selenomonas sp. TAMA-11512 TaxID=3095337 RepID=UPI0030878C71|nr:hypothetical protein TAMA11512_11840 [Selenomonas sp. TAMA-11512]